MRTLLEHIMLSDGYQVTAAESMSRALSLIEVEPFDFVVTDVNLPDGSGLNVADKAIQKGIGALVVTGYGLILAPGALAGYDYLLKPLAPRELREAIRRRLPER